MVAIWLLHSVYYSVFSGVRLFFFFCRLRKNDFIFYYRIRESFFFDFQYYSNIYFVCGVCVYGQISLCLRWQCCVLETQYTCFFRLILAHFWLICNLPWLTQMCMISSVNKVLFFCFSVWFNFFFGFLWLELWVWKLIQSVFEWSCGA